MIELSLYVDKISPLIGKPVIKVISGMRRCGESTFLKMLMERLIQGGVMLLSMDTVWGNDRNGIIRQNIIDFLLAGEGQSDAPVHA